MLMPTLWDIFDEFRLANDLSHKIGERKSSLLGTIDVLELEGFKLGCEAREEIESKADILITEAQFHGFVQGFCFARTMFGDRFE